MNGRFTATGRWFVIAFLSVLMISIFTVGTLWVRAESLDEVNQERAAKEAQLNAVFSDIERIRNSNASLSEKLATLKKEVVKLKKLSDELNKDLSALDEAYAAQTNKLQEAYRQLQVKRAELYIHSQRTLPQIMLSSGSFGEFMKTLLYEQIYYSTLVEEQRRLRTEVVKQQEVIGQISQSRSALMLQLTAAKEKVQELEDEQKDLNASLQVRYQRQSSLTREIATLSAQAQSIIDRKANSSGSPNNGGGNSGGGGGNTVPPQDTPGDYSLSIASTGLSKTVQGPLRLVTSKGYVTTYYYDSSGNVTNQHRYRGTLEFRHDSNVRIINELSIESYLKGLGEMPSSWHLEALKAQAAAGRTYAIANLKKRAMYNYDLRDDVNDQNYEGYDKEAAGGNWPSAVEQTANKVVKSGSSYISTYYHSTCGGHTLSSAEVWGGTRAYAQAVSDRFSSNGTWKSYEETAGASRALWSAGSYTNTAAYMNDYLNVALYLAANNNSTTAQNNVACTLNTLNQSTGACSANGRTVYTSAKLRQVLGTGSIESRVGVIQSIQQIYNDGGVAIGQNSKFTKQLKITGASGVVVLDGQVFKLAYNLRAPGDNWIASTLYDVKRVNSNNWQLLSRGWGHRVGMCQYGAQGRALAGQKYDQILKAYYQGVTVADYALPRPIRIGLTKAGGRSTYIKATDTVTISDKNGVVTSVPANTVIRIR